MNLGIRRLIDRNIHSEDSDKMKMARLLDVMVDGLEDVQGGPKPTRYSDYSGRDCSKCRPQDVLWLKCQHLKTEIGKIINES